MMQRDTETTMVPGAGTVPGGGFSMQAALRLCGIDNPVIDAWREATEWRQNHAWTWPTGNEPWFAILQNISIGLVYGGATKIKGYVFESPKLPEIRGASALLDRINGVDLPLLWQDSGLARAAIVYTSGGTVLGFTYAGGQADMIACQIEQIYTRETLTANSVAVGHDFALLDVLFGRNAGNYGLQQFRDHWHASCADQTLRETLEKYYYDPKQPPDIDELTRRFLNRKGFGELVTLLATMANRRREELMTYGQRRDIPHYALIPWTQKCQTSDIRAAVITKPKPGTVDLSEASARKAYVGRLLKRDEQPLEWFEHCSSWRYRDAGSAVASAADHEADFPALHSWETRWAKWLHAKANTPRYASPMQGKQIDAEKIQASRDVGDIGAASTSPRTRGYIGLIYADGDRVGQRIATLKTVDTYANFANKLSLAAEEAVFTAFATHLTPHQQGHTWRHPFEIITIGGDDLIILVPGDTALEIAATIGYTFEQRMATCDTQRSHPFDRYSGIVTPDFDSYTPDIGISAGVVIAPENTPIFFLQRLAEELQKSAKTKAKACMNDDAHSGGAVDFMVLKSITMVTDQIASFRREAYGVGVKPAVGLPVERTARPFTWRELAGLIHTVRLFKKHGVPRSQLYRMRQLMFDDPAPMYASVVEFLYTMVRQKQDVQAALQQFRDTWMPADDSSSALAPWRLNERPKHGTSVSYWETIWPDIVEIYDFVSEKGKSDA